MKKLRSLSADGIQKTKEVNKEVCSTSLPSTGEKEKIKPNQMHQNKLIV